MERRNQGGIGEEVEHTWNRKCRHHDTDRVRVKERTEHVRMEEWGRSMAHNVTPDIAETEINKLSVSLY